MKAKLTAIILFCSTTIFISAISLVMPTNNLVLARSSTEQKQQADRYLSQAETQLQQGSLLSAKGNFQQALRIYQSLKDNQGQSNALVGLARIDYQEARYSQALNNLRQAERLNQERFNGQLLSTKGLVYLELGDYREALQNLRTGVHYLSVSGDRSRAGYNNLQAARIGLAETHFYLGQYQSAIHSLQSEINRTRDLHQKRRVYNLLGSTQLELGQPELALDSFQQALSVPNIPGDRVGKAKTLVNLGRGEQALGNLKVALKYYQQALGEFNSLGAWGQQVFVLNRLGELAGDLGLENRALEYLKEAEASFSSHGGGGKVLTLINLGDYYARREDLKEAQEYYQEALNWAVSNGDRIGETQALQGIGKIQLQSGKISEAIKNLSLSIEVFEALRPGLRDEAKVSLFDTQVRTYEMLQQAYITAAQPDEALIIAERSRARSFLELLAQKLDSKTERQAKLQAPQIKDIQRVARDRNSTLVSYSIINDSNNRESQLYIWVVNPQGKINFRQLDLTQLRNTYDNSVATLSQNTNDSAGMGFDTEKPPIDDLENLIVTMRGNPEANQPKTNRKRVATLNGYRVLIEPIADLLPSNPEDKIIFIPQGMLFLVPFAALQSDDGTYLIENHTLQIAPSIQTLMLQSALRRNTNNNSALIVGNPEPMPKDLSSLPGTETEAKEIAKILNAEAILNGAATESIVKEKISQAKIIHFATHGLFNEYEGLQSSLALSATDGDGFLTADEIIDLDLQAELVVLSACNTGRGRITGDGVIGLSRSFLAAGAQSAIASLWYVPDLPTATLMIEFYRQLEQTNDTAQALRQAMLTMLEENPNPLNWAGFIAIGQ